MSIQMEVAIWEDKGLGWCLKISDATGRRLAYLDTYFIEAILPWAEILSAGPLLWAEYPEGWRWAIVCDQGSLVSNEAAIDGAQSERDADLCHLVIQELKKEHQGRISMCPETIMLAVEYEPPPVPIQRADIHADLVQMLGDIRLLHNGNTDPGISAGLRAAIEVIEPLRDKYAPEVTP